MARMGFGILFSFSFIIHLIITHSFISIASSYRMSDGMSSCTTASVDFQTLRYRHEHQPPKGLEKFADSFMDYNGVELFNDLIDDFDILFGVWKREDLILKKQYRFVKHTLNIWEKRQARSMKNSKIPAVENSTNSTFLNVTLPVAEQRKMLPKNQLARQLQKASYDICKTVEAFAEATQKEYSRTFSQAYDDMERELLASPRKNLPYDFEIAKIVQRREEGIAKINKNWNDGNALLADLLAYLDCPSS